jgi:methylase of polypeptide subunit release factors
MIGLSLLQRAAHRVYRSKFVARRLFGIQLPALGPKDYYFDISTWIVVREVARRIGPENHLLDLGTGSFGVIGISLWKKTGCQVTSVDIDPELVASTRRNVELNRAPIEVVHSNLFQEVKVPFDVVTFNPPYLTTEAGQSLHIDARQGQWDGGAEGTSAVGPFLKAVAARPNHVTAYLAMNTLFVKGDVIRAMVAKEPGLRYRETITSRLLPIDLHVFENVR